MSRYNNIFNVKSAQDIMPSMGDIPRMNSDIYITYISSDRLDLISNRIYGDPQYWWMILAANGYQIEFDIEDGEILRVPYPLSDAINSIRKNINGK
jgi:hypothetical protein